MTTNENRTTKMEWNNRLLEICQIYQIRCIGGVAYCNLEEPCKNIITIYERELKGLPTAINY